MVFGTLDKRDCETQCERHCWIKQKTYQVRSPFRDGEKLPMVSFETEDEFFNWFFVKSDNDPGSNYFDDFCLTGCWNWILFDPNTKEYNEILTKLTAAKDLGIHPTGCSFDDSPAICIEQLLVANSELGKATNAKLKRQK